MYEQLVPLREKQQTPVGWRAMCAKCGSEVELVAEELYPGAWIHTLFVRPSADLVEKGATTAGPLFRPKPLYAVGPKERGRTKAEAAFPAVSEKRWLAWMREPAAASSRSDADLRK